MRLVGLCSEFLARLVSFSEPAPNMFSGSQEAKVDRISLPGKRNRTGPSWLTGAVRSYHRLGEQIRSDKRSA